MTNTSPNEKHQGRDGAHFSAVGFPEEQCGASRETWAPLSPVPFISSVRFTYSSILSSAQMGTTQKVVTRINEVIHI